MSTLVDTSASTSGKRPSGAAIKTVSFFLGAFVIGAFVMLAIQQLGSDDDPGLVFEIPAGAKNSVPAGLKSAVDVPREIIFADGDTAKITVINHDDVTHLAGPFLVAPGETYVQTFPNQGVFPITCSVNLDESIVVKVE